MPKNATTAMGKAKQAAKPSAMKAPPMAKSKTTKSMAKANANAAASTPKASADEGEDTEYRLQVREKMLCYWGDGEWKTIHPIWVGEFCWHGLSLCMRMNPRRG